jgi:hypothetical protein
LNGAIAHRAPVRRRARSRVAGMALDPVPGNLVAFDRLVQRLPQLGVLHRLLVGGLPAVPLPAVNPAGDAVLHIFAESVCISTSHGSFSAFSASIAAISSMRLLVVSASPPDSSLRVPLKRRIAPQPPGPGLPEQAPSVKILDASSSCHATARIPTRRTCRWNRIRRRYSSGSFLTTRLPAGVFSQS